MIALNHRRRVHKRELNVPLCYLIHALLQVPAGVEAGHAGVVAAGHLRGCRGRKEMEDKVIKYQGN